MVSLNKIFFGLFFLMLIVGVYTYQMLWFQSSDELITLLMALLCMLDMLANKNHQRYKGLFAVVGVMTFYLLYSMFCPSLQHAQGDSVRFLYPDQTLYRLLCRLFHGCSVRCFPEAVPQTVVCIPEWADAVDYPFGVWNEILFSCSPLRYYQYGFVPDILLLLLSKSYQERQDCDDAPVGGGLFQYPFQILWLFVVAMYIFFWYKPGILVRVKLKQWITIALVFCVVLYVAWGKINYYFISSGLFTGSEDQKDSFARAILYVRSPEILMDHFVFGSGLASYATYSSGDVGYSRVYENYNIENVWGLQEGDCPFVSDTFFPELVQFGIVGIILFFYFWVWVYRKIKPGMPMSSRYNCIR